jgi:Spy/CpxP family protein refolding chaperone
MMRFSRLWAVALAVPMLGAAVAFAEDAAKPADKPAAKAKADRAPALKGLYAQMPGELSLSEEQKAKILTISTERDAAIKAWNQTNEAKLKELRAKAESAMGGGDKAGAKDARDEAARLKAEQTAIGDKYDDQIEAVLTPDQQARWAGYKLYVGNAGMFKKLNLTEEQKNQLKERYIQAGAQIKAAGTPKEKSAIGAKIREQAEADILTAEQRAALTAEREAAKKAKEAAKGM